MRECHGDLHLGNIAVIDGERVLGYREAIVLEESPKRFVVIGTGAIGVEFAGADQDGNSVWPDDEVQPW